MNSPIIGTGFWASEQEHDAKTDFFLRYWRRGVSGHRVIIVDNSVRGLNIPSPLPTETIVRCTYNLGHACDHQSGNEPHLRGWSMSWIVPALIAYSNASDFIYVEQDVLLFGQWMDALVSESQRNGWLASFGRGTNMPCEQSLFWIQSQAITRFVSAYMAISDSDYHMLPENKFAMMRRADSRIGVHSLGVGRGRPITPNAPAWYFQQPSAIELILLKQKGML